MKNKIYIEFTLIIFITVIISFSGIPSSEPVTTGTVTVCWDPLCGVPNTTEIVELVEDSSGTTVGSCQLDPSENCCIIQGDFPSGKYYLRWHQPESRNKCTSSVFYYVNGTNVEFDIICNCTFVPAKTN